MASNSVCLVAVFLVLTSVFTSAYIPAYPAPYPMPYGQQYPYQGMVPYGQGYPMYPYQPQYPMMPPPYPYSMQFPGQYPPQYPMYAQNAPVMPMSGMDGNLPEGLPAFPGQPDPSQMAAGFPNQPQTIATQYGNIPIDIVDVAGPQGWPNAQFNPYANVGSNQVLHLKGDDLDQNQTDALVETAQNVLEVPNKGIKTESIVEAESSQTKIVRTVYPKTGKVDVEIQTKKSEMANAVEDTNTVKPKTEFMKFG